MEAILAELASGGEAVAAAIGAGVVAGAQGVQFLVARARNGKSRPGQTAACVDHLTRLGQIETAVDFVREDVKRVEKSLGEDLKRVEKEVGKVSDKLDLVLAKP